MKNAAIGAQWKGFRSQIDQWWHTRTSLELLKDDREREQSIGILQKRYGYTKEKAIDELNKHYLKARLG